MKSFFKNLNKAEIDEIKSRLTRLENSLGSGHGANFDEQLARLGQKIVNNHPNMNQYNERFRTYEAAILNIKNMGYNIGKYLYDLRKDRIALGPTTIALKSKLCTQEDMEADWVNFWCRELRTAPVYHRKIWELCYIAQALYTANKLRDGMKGIVFGCGDEPLPSLFAKYGCTIVATDLSPDDAGSKGWIDTNQHTTGLELIKKRDVCPDEAALQNISLEYVDMNNIPRKYDGQFDFCWSACAFEHVGSIAKGLDFVENSLRCLKPGGVAVHTTEYNILDDVETLDNWGTVLYQKKHLTDFSTRMSERGYLMEELDLSPGGGILDGFVDLPPWTVPPWTESRGRPGEVAHLKLCVDGLPCTSVGLIVTKPR